MRQRYVFEHIYICIYIYECIYVAKLIKSVTLYWIFSLLSYWLRFCSMMMPLNTLPPFKQVKYVLKSWKILNLYGVKQTNCNWQISCMQVSVTIGLFVYLH